VEKIKKASSYDWALISFQYDWALISFQEKFFNYLYP
jgi:hypothetical protein